MLKLVSIRPALPIHSKRDDYIPLTLETDAPPSDFGYTFVYDVAGQGLAEFVIAQETGRFYRCVIVSKPQNITGNLEAISSLPSQHGLPIFALGPSDMASTGLRREIRDTMFGYQTPDAVFVNWGAFEPNRKIVCGEANFLFHDDLLVGFGATGLANP